MNELKVADLMGLEEYHRARPEFRKRVLAHKRRRQVGVGPNATLYFEDRLTIQYQVQEMLRIERIFEREAIEEELETYNPLIPDGSCLMATFMVEFPDPEQRRRELARLVGIEDRVYIRVAGFDPVTAVADEDLDRSTEKKTSAVHFLRFRLSPAVSAALKEGRALAVGIDHPHYRYAVDPVAGPVRDALAADLE